MKRCPGGACAVNEDWSRVLELCNSGSTRNYRSYGSQMECWLQLMCSTLAVVLVLYFGDVRGRLRRGQERR